jgi:hypothetical protein
MIGVTNPGGSVRPRKEVYAAVASLAIGYSISTAFVALVLTTVAAVVPHYFSDSLRLGAVISVLILFGLADLTGRTPMTQRQVPQVFARTLGVAPRNLLWGLDLGLLNDTEDQLPYLDRDYHFAYRRTGPDSHRVGPIGRRGGVPRGIHRSSRFKARMEGDPAVGISGTQWDGPGNNPSRVRSVRTGYCSYSSGVSAWIISWRAYKAALW